MGATPPFLLVVIILDTKEELHTCLPVQPWGKVECGEEGGGLAGEEEGGVS